MNMNSNTKPTFEELLNEAEELLVFKTKEEKTGFDKDVLQLEIMHEVQKLMDNEGLSRKELAEKLGKSKSFVSQLFSCDKKLHFGLLTQFQEIFKGKFKFSFIPFSDYNPKMVIDDYKDGLEERCSFAITQKTN
ncbi:MAG: helix-turn-helix transcriptional regulator [Ignavibacteria bacterium]|nr:helix-turn-helix transcriptional regulator [Ignavibacteria bacterium]